MRCALSVFSPALLAVSGVRVLVVLFYTAFIGRAFNAEALMFIWDEITASFRIDTYTKLQKNIRSLI